MPIFTGAKTMSEFDHMVSKARQASRGGFDVLSTGEKLAAALILNRPDWLDDMGYTIPEALARVGEGWVAMIPAAAKLLNDTDVVVRKAEKGARDEASLQSVALKAVGENVVDVNAVLVSSGQAPGYRDASFTFDIQRMGGDQTHRLCFRVSPQDSEAMAQHLLEVPRMAWERGQPIDVRPGDRRPRWIG